MTRPKSVLALVALLMATVAFAHHGPAKVTIDGAASKQAAVTFDHANHATKLVKSCDTCHHTQKGLTTDEGTKVVKCTTCHLNAKGKVPSMREAGLTKNPFHMVCIDCHKKEKKGPVICTGCHVKK